jgi:dinuclear metal center YbgI/SA1388 family protein
LIISHHPLIFHGIKKITPTGFVERALIKAIKADVAIAAMHTNLDNSAQGVNKKIADKLGLQEAKILQPVKGKLKKLVTFCPVDQAEKVRHAMFNAGAGHIGNYDSCSFNSEGTGTFKGGENTNPYVGNKGVMHFEKELRIETIVPDHLINSVTKAMIQSHPYEEVAYDIYPLDNIFDTVGAGMIGNLQQAVTEKAFLEHVSATFGTTFLRHSPFVGKKIQKVAVCGGSGAFLLKAAISAGADAFITADIKYHDFFEAENSLLLVDAGHYETEQFTKDLIADILRKKIPNFAVLFSEVHTNAVGYFTHSNI